MTAAETEHGRLNIAMFRKDAERWATRTSHSIEILISERNLAKFGSGLELCSRLLAFPTSDQPVVVLTARDVALTRQIASKLARPATHRPSQLPPAAEESVNGLLTTVPPSFLSRRYPRGNE
jgi:CheY-like chemotaxis protein